MESDHEDEEKEQPRTLSLISMVLFMKELLQLLRDGFDIIIDDNSTNWREDRFDAN